MFIRLRQLLRRGRCQKGAAAVEFAVVFPILLLLVAGIMDFGHYWYIGHVLSDASREGARYGSRYVTHFDPTKGTVRTLPQNLIPTISDHVLLSAYANYANRLPTTPSPTVTPSGAGYTNTNPTAVAGKDLIITVSATKTWWVLGSLIPTLGSTKLLTVNTTMTCE
jgi:Flp pilus assembly protein TadG